MKKLHLIFGLVYLLNMPIIHAQQTVGIFLNTPQALDGYTLLSPFRNTETYLINNCGERVHSWSGTSMSTLSVYLNQNGYLYRSGRNTTIGQSRGQVEVLDWNSNIVWTYSADSMFGTQHHDIEILPNGNILIIANDEYTTTEVLQNGGSTTLSALLSEQIIEIKPNFTTGGDSVVWQWKAWDHLIQDTDDSKPNYGIISDHPERIDINYTGLNMVDWLHFNSIDYNSSLDQIVMSVPEFNEIWIIDHSTTTQQAASNNGGNSGKGGDLLYRWGNPAAYQQGTANDQQLFYQHYPNWIESSYADGGKIMVFNNRLGQSSGQPHSAIGIIQPPIDSNGAYIYNNAAFAPANFDWTYTDLPLTNFYSQIMSSAERLENGNTFICEGITGRLFEVDSVGNIVWEYVNPVGVNGPVQQTTFPSNRNVFRASKYPIDYPGLAGQDLTPQGYLEIGSTFTCTLYPDSTVNTSSLLKDFDVHIYPNPVSNTLTIEGDLVNGQVQIINLAGQICNITTVKGNSSILDMSNLPSGMYVVRIVDFEHNLVVCKKMVKQ